MVRAPSILAVLALYATMAAATEPALSRRDVVFDSSGLSLAGTLLAPPGNGPFPGVVLVHGSGEADRGSLGGWAEGLARAGLATLAYDKRGVGESQGPRDAWRRFSIEDLAGDAAAALAFMRKQPEIEPSRVGLLGASQGGWVAPLAARKDGSTAFLIIVSGSATTIAEDNLFERSARLAREGFTPEQVAEARAMHLVDLELSRSGTGFDEFQALWRANQDKAWFRRVYLDKAPAPADAPYRLWYRTVMDFDPVPILQGLDMPAIWLYGDPERDTLAPVARSAEILEALRSAGKPYEIHVFEGADHQLNLEGGEMAPFVEPLQQWLAREVLAGP